MNKHIEFRAGAGKSEIEYPADIFPFRDGPDLWTGIHDIPCVRAVLLDCGIRMILVSLEVVLLDRALDEQIRRTITDLTGIPNEHIWISATHTVSTPHFFIFPHNTPEENELAALMRANIHDAASKAVSIAYSSVQSASLGFGCGTCRANVNRVIETKDGWWLGSGEEWTADHSVPVIRIDGSDQKPLAILYHYNCELAVMDKSVMSDGGRHVTADLAGVASHFIENEYNDEVVALFLPGVSIDQGPAYRAVRTVRGRNGSYHTVDIKEKGWTLLELEGERLGEQVLLAAEQAVCTSPSRSISLDNRTFWFPGQKLRGLPNPNTGPVKEWPFTPDKDRTRSVEVMRLGDIVLVAAGALGIDTVQNLQSRSPFAKTIVLSSVEGGAKRLPTDGAKYMAEKHMYEKVTFQARNSEFAAGSAEKMLEDILTFLNDLAAVD